MKKNILLLLTCSGFLSLLFYACTVDQIPEPGIKTCDSTFVNYNDHIKPIVDSKCSVSGCHDGGTAAGGLITESYAAMLNSINNGSFASRVLDIGDMPQNDTLSAEQFDLIACWKDDGYPEFAVALVDPCPNDTITYHDTIKTIIDAGCAVAGCHDGATMAGGLSTVSYSDMSAAINNASIYDRAIDAHNEPTTTISQADLDLLLCWKFDQFAEGVADPCSGNYTYDGGINSLINSKCSTPGCHGSGSTSGGLSTESYAALNTVLTNGKFNTRVLVQQNMPPGLDSLTAAQIDSLECWKNAGYPEN